MRGHQRLVLGPRPERFGAIRRRRADAGSWSSAHSPPSPQARAATWVPLATILTSAGPHRRPGGPQPGPAQPSMGRIARSPPVLRQHRMDQRRVLEIQPPGDRARSRPATSNQVPSRCRKPHLRSTARDAGRRPRPGPGRRRPATPAPAAAHTPGWRPPALPGRHDRVPDLDHGPPAGLRRPVETDVAHHHIVPVPAADARSGAATTDRPSRIGAGRVVSQLAAGPRR